MLSSLLILALLLFPVGDAGITKWAQPSGNTSGNFVASPAESNSEEFTLERNMASFGKSAGVRTILFTVNRMHVKCRKLSPGSASFGVLEIGDSGPLVQHAQRLLKISPDGIFGPETHATVVNTQQGNLLLVDGEIGRQTACAIGLRASSIGNRQSKPSAKDTTFNMPMGFGGTVIAVARRFLGIPYVWGGASRSGMDCSGFTMMVYAIALHLHLPHFSEDQPQFGRRVINPSPGDLVKWPGHVAIYYGGGMVIGARHSGVLSQIYHLYGNPLFYRMGK